MDSRDRPHPPAARSIVAALAVSLLATGSPAELLRAPGGDLLVRSSAEYVVRPAGGGRVALPLSERAIAGDLRSAGGSWWVAAVDRDAGGPKLALFAGRGGLVETLPVPDAGPARVVHGPQLLTDGGGLRGVAWLEGEAVTRLQVRAARWQGGRWTPPVTVSPAGPGTQIALTVTRLAGGSWLAAWSAFDGRDDEILWSRLAGGSWSPPRSAAEDNQVPDITPRLVSSGAGALLAWTRYDGNDYRVHTARFDDGRWSRPLQVGPKGSVEPSFGGRRPGTGGTPLLVYRRAVSDDWWVAELDAAGEVLRTAGPAKATLDEPPAVAEVTADGVVLAWADRSATLRWPR